MNAHFYKYILSAGFMGILLAGSGCSNEAYLPDQGEAEADADRMTFLVAHPAQQTTTRVTSTAFEANDTIGLYITLQDQTLELADNYVNNAPLVFDGNQWTPNRTIYWNNGTYDIYAYYPFDTPLTSVEDAPFSVATDQNAEGGYEASDFLWAGSKAVSASNGQVSLQFQHRMSRLLIKLIKGEDYEGDLPEDAEVYIHNTVPSSTIDLSVGVVTRNAYGSVKSIRACSLGDHKYAAIIVPQRLDNRQPLVEVIMKGVSYLYESKFQFKQGIQHSLQLAVSKNPEQVKIEIGGEVENWD
ncbi:MAG: fimbrillin family protein [Bacteroides sp.]|nr:fimbrillin family protein [Bacteroides sp.]